MVRNLEVLRALLARAVGLSADGLCGVSEYLGRCLGENCIIHSGTCSTGIYRCSLHGVCWARGLPRCCPSHRGAFRWIQGPGNPLMVGQVSRGHAEERQGDPRGRDCGLPVSYPHRWGLCRE